MILVGRADPPVVVLGAGIGGLVAARTLRRRGLRVAVFEAGRRVAGMATSFHDADGFTYDFGAHFITNRLAAALGVSDVCRAVERYGESVFARGRATAYPVGLIRSPRYLAGALHAKLPAWRAREPARDAAE
ncbi:MAG TPA: FAD-dependent oxidoreductase, partial [Gemmatirosa sp.]